jgi:hypothetical protein
LLQHWHPLRVGEQVSNERQQERYHYAFWTACERSNHRVKLAFDDWAGVSVDDLLDETAHMRAVARASQPVEHRDRRHGGGSGARKHSQPAYR